MSMGNAIRVTEAIDQRSVQRYGGDFARFPSSYVVCKLLRQYSIRKVLDVTYGEGRFYYLCRNELEIIAADPVKWNCIVKPRQFLQLNVFQLYLMLRDGKIELPHVDALVVDPPKWTTNVSYRKRDMYNFIIGTPKLIIEYASKIASLLKTQYLLAHYREVIQLENYVPTHIIEFTWIARYLHTKNKNRSLYILCKVKQ
uniref:SAM-dependent methyltransferase n=1 Tax=Ignisphaera aggregans TaxID=334771 RepID=A0A7J2U157_9CREN